MERQEDPKEEANPRAVASAVLLDLEHPGSRVAERLRARGSGLHDPRDWRLATELVYGTLRHLARLDYHLLKLSGRPLERVPSALLAPLRIGLYQILLLDRIPSSAAVNESVRIASQTAGSKGAGFVNAVLRKAVHQRGSLRLERQGNPALDLALEWSVPSWMVARWIDRLGEVETRALLEAFSKPSPTSMWVNPRRGTLASLVEILEGEGVEATRWENSPNLLRIVRGNPARTRAFACGVGYLLDEASLAISDLLPIAQGQRVLDLCAAPGGKAFPLACRLGTTGCVVAVDKSLDRLELLRSNRERLGISSVLPVVADLERPLPFAARFASILLDAPCSGTGTLGRRPEIRWRLQPHDLLSLARRQGRFLQRAGDLLKPAGHLLYSVCSLEPEEGKVQIDRFLHENPRFEVRDLGPLVPEPLRSALTPEGTFQTWPHRHGTDGFFAALLQKES